ncbi:MAG: ABC transporter permease subunit [Acetobacteraceae bacterium]|nr:ABC transporter permease subunit [Acetobacteraceae bacterium]
MNRSVGRGPAAFALLWLILVGAVPLGRLLAEGVAASPLAVLDEPAVAAAALTSLAVAAGASLCAGLIGSALAYALYLRGPPPGRGVLVFLSVLPLLIPPQVMALGWIQASGPASPLLLALGLAPPLGTPNPVYGLGGMIAILGVQGAPLVLLSVAGTLRRLPAEVVRAAAALGASPAQVLGRVLLPLLAPAVAAGAALAWIAALGNFGVGILVGLPARRIVMTVLIWRRLSLGGPAALGQAAALSLVLAVMASPALAVQWWAGRRSPTPSGAPFVPLAGGGGLAASLAIAAYLVVVLAVPFAALVSASLVPAVGVEISAATATLRNYAAALAPGAHTALAIRNSVGLSLTAAALLAAAALAVALTARRPAVRLASSASDLAYALPGTCTAIAVILVVLSVPGGIVLYGSLAAILLAYLARFQALALRPVAAAAARLDPMLDRAAMSLGATALQRLGRVQAPLLAPAMAAGAILVALTAVNEVTVSSLLYGPGSQTLGVLVFTLQESGQSAQAAAVSVLALLLMGGLMAAATLAARRLPAGTLPWRP